MVVSARAAVERARHEEMAALAGRIREGLGGGGRGVSGFDDVMAAVGRGQLQTLLVDRNRRLPGWRCGLCDQAGLIAVASCPVCGGEPVPVSDVIGEIVRLTILHNGRVEVGENIPVLDDLGGVAGLLRYA